MAVVLAAAVAVVAIAPAVEAVAVQAVAAVTAAKFQRSTINTAVLLREQQGVN